MLGITNLNGLNEKKKEEDNQEIAKKMQISFLVAQVVIPVEETARKIAELDSQNRGVPFWTSFIEENRRKIGIRSF